jgi:hypothetical protein
MAAPFPPQGNQSQHTERPLKVYAEQYLAGQPLPVGATATAFPPIFAEGDARVYGSQGRVYLLHDTDWVISNRYTGQPVEVISHEEMSERFGTEGEVIT